MNTVRSLLFPALIGFISTFLGVWLSAENHLQTEQPPASPHSAIQGAWTFNADLSDKPQSEDRQEGGEGGRRGGYGRGGGMGGGFGGRRGGGMGRGGYGGGSRPDPDQMARMRDAMHDYLVPPSRLTIVQADSLIVITTAEGHVTRLAPDGKKVKDDNTKIERKTKWDGDKLVSEVSGIGRGKITETYTIDAEHHQLIETIAMEGSRQARTQKRVYDAESSR